MIRSVAEERQLDDLMIQWQRSRELGEEVPVDHLCHDCPELGPRLADRIRALRALSWLEEPDEESETRDAACAGGDYHLEQGQRLGNYIVLEEIGRGGMGRVYKARHLRMNRIVALKVLPEWAIGSSSAIERFRREVQALAKLNHPNIVTAYDADEAGEIQFLVMEYIEGRDLASMVSDDGPLSTSDAIDFTLQAAQGLAYAHDQGILHRDVKPSNLLLCSSNSARGNSPVIPRPGDQVKILDLGLARLDGSPEVTPFVETSGGGDTAKQDLTQDGAVMGTAGFMSPEQATAMKHVDERSDIFSLGRTLFFLLTGKPKHGEAEMVRLTSKENWPTDSLLAERSDIPEPLEAIYQRMAARVPADRFQTMNEVVTELESCRRDPVAGPARRGAESNAAHSVQLLRSALKWSPLIGLVTLLLIAGGWLLAGVLFQVETPAGTIVVEVEQPGIAGAEISIDGDKKVTIKTPFEKQPVTIEADEGKHTLRVTKGGFQTWTKELEVVAGRAQRIRVHLIPLAPALPRASERDTTAHAETSFQEGISGYTGTQDVVIASHEPDKNVDSAVISNDVADQDPRDYQQALIRFDDLVGHQPHQVPAGANVVSASLQLTAFNAGSSVIAYRVLEPWDESATFDKIDGGADRRSDTPDDSVRGRLGPISLDVTRSVKAWVESGETNYGWVLMNGGVDAVAIYASEHVQSLHRPKLIVKYEIDPRSANAPNGSDKKSPISQAEIVEREIRKTIGKPTGELTQADFEKVNVFDFRSPLLTDEGLREVTKLTKLSRLYLNETSITDEGLKHVAKLRELRYLDLSSTKTTNAGLRELAELSQLAELNLYNTQTTDEGLKEIARLERLTYLNLLGTGISDAGLRELAKLNRLDTLWLVGTQITDAGLKEVAKLKQLTALSLDSTQTTDAGLKEVAKLDRLSYLNLSATQITDAGLKDVAKLQQLSHLNLSFCEGTTDTGIKELAELAKLTVLRFNGCTQLTDAGLKQVSRLDRLSYLDCQGTQVTDAGLEELSRLAQLSRLDLHHTKVTKAGVDELQRALPKLQINHNAADRETPDPRSRTAFRSEGVVLQVSRESNRLVEFSLGADDGIRVGVELDVYRDDKVIARIVVRQVKENLAIGESLKHFKTGLIRKGDRVGLPWPPESPAEHSSSPN